MERIENGGAPLPCRNLLFGKYQFGRLLGQGTFAKVYYAKNLLTDEPVAIKVLHKDQVRKQGLMEQIKREISVMHLVKHPNVVELKEVMANKSKIFFVMEYVKGGELFAKVSKGKLPESDARRYFQQLISAVDFCHSRGVSHRDLKPENLLLDENGNLKISDFGLSALPEQNWHDGLLHTQCGTPAYVAPEVLQKRGYDGAKADLWSCGVVLYVLLAGFLPFQDENIMNMYRKVFKAEFEFPPWFSSDVRHLLSKLLVTDPKKRITIDKIMEVPWFKKGFTRPTGFELLSPVPDSGVMEALKSESETPTPEFFNAFELISSMSSGFDLSGFFESKKKAGSMFTSKCSACTALSKLEGLAKVFKFKVTKVKDFKIKMQRSEPGRLGPLAVTAEIFELTPELAVVEFDKSSGDTLEYLEFCEEVRPALRDIIWAWQGEDDEEEAETDSMVPLKHQEKKHGHREAQAAAA